LKRIFAGIVKKDKGDGGLQPAIIKSIIFKLKNLKLKNKKLGAGIGIAVIIFAAGLFFFSGDSGASAEVVKAGRQDIEEYVLANGRVEVPSRQDFVARSSGLVEAVLVRPGDRVKAGQVLLRLDDDEPFMNLRQEEASLAARRAELARPGRPQDPKKDMPGA
jgi:multidrug efflux pump subunit AcrA (membrane-fusion protein)